MTSVELTENISASVTTTEQESLLPSSEGKDLDQTENMAPNDGSAYLGSGGVVIGEDNKSNSNLVRVESYNGSGGKLESVGCDTATIPHVSIYPPSTHNGNTMEAGFVGDDFEKKSGGINTDGLTKAELMPYINDPFWKRLRWFLFILYWVIWVAMLVVAIALIVVAPKCASPSPKKWWQKRSIYHIDVPTFKDSNFDGIGDIKGIISQKEYIGRQGVGSVRLSASLPTPLISTADLKAIESQFGDVSDLKTLVKSLKDESDIKIVLDFTPVYTSINHEWFKDSSSDVSSGFTDYYVWKDVASDASVENSPDWTFESVRNAYYLNYKGDSSKARLNYESEGVQMSVKDVLKFWLTEIGVDGFAMLDVSDLALSSSSPLPSVSGENVDDIVNQLMKWREVLNDVTKQSGDDDEPRILMTEDLNVDDETISKFYGSPDSDDGTSSIVHLPMNNDFDDLTPNDLVADQLKSKIESYRSKLPFPSAWPNFKTSKSLLLTLSDRKLVEAMLMIALTLPGTPVIRAGDEMGGIDVDGGFVQWDTIAVYPMESFSALNKLRESSTLKFGDFQIASNSSVFAMTRVRKGSPGFLTIFNTDPTQSYTVNLLEASQVSDVIKDGDMVQEQPPVELFLDSLPNRATVKVRNMDGVSNQLDLSAVELRAHEALICMFVPNF